MHVHQQRATADDLDQLDSPARLTSAGRTGWTSSTQTSPGAPALGECGTPLPTVHQSNDRGSRDEPPRGHGGRLDGGDYSPGRAPPLQERARNRLCSHDLRLAGGHGDSVDLLGIAHDRPQAPLIDTRIRLQRLTHPGECRGLPRLHLEQALVHAIAALNLAAHPFHGTVHRLVHLERPARLGALLWRAFGRVKLHLVEARRHARVLVGGLDPQHEHAYRIDLRALAQRGDPAERQ